MAALISILSIALSALVIEDLAGVGAGLAAAGGTIGLGQALVGFYLGLLGGDLFFFAGGRYLGRWAVHLRPFSWFVTEAQLDRCTAWLDRHGRAAIIVSRFLPALRSAVPFAVGLGERPAPRILPWFALATLLYSPLPVLAAYFFGEAVQRYVILYHRWGLAAAGALVVGWLVARRYLYRIDPSAASASPSGPRKNDRMERTKSVSA